LDADLNTGATASMTLNNTTGVQNKPGVVVVDRIDTNGNEQSAALREYIVFTGTSGATLTGLTRGLGGSSDQDHSTGAVVEFIYDVVAAQAIIDAIGLVVDEDDIANVNTTNVVTPAGTQTLTNKTVDDPIVTGDFSGNAFLDEDDLSSDSATKVASQQSIKAYVDPTTTSVASSATPTPTGDKKINEYYLTALAAAATFAAPSGTPANGNKLIIRILDNGTARALTYNSIYRAVGITLPTTTVASKTTYIGAIYNSADSKWDCVATITES
jgi:hypothetical protein